MVSRTVEAPVSHHFYGRLSPYLFVSFESVFDDICIGVVVGREIVAYGSLSKPVGYFLCMTHFQEAEMNSKERRRSFKICKITSRKVYGAERSLPFLKGGGGRDFLESI
jgi:hypothetical protein